VRKWPAVASRASTSGTFQNWRGGPGV